jgi:hypothetical protein
MSFREALAARVLPRYSAQSAMAGQSAVVASERTHVSAACLTEVNARADFPSRPIGELTQ